MDGRIGFGLFESEQLYPFRPGSLEVSNGKLVATPASLDESSVMITIKDSDCLIVVPPELRGAVKGQTVQVLVLPGAWT